MVDRISEARLKRLDLLGMIREIVRNRKGDAKAAKMWVRPGECILSRMGQQAYSYQQKLDIYRVWSLMRISDADRPVFQTSITDNMVYLDQHGRKTRAVA